MIELKNCIVSFQKDELSPDEAAEMFYKICEEARSFFTAWPLCVAAHKGDLT